MTTDGDWAPPPPLSYVPPFLNVSCLSLSLSTFFSLSLFFFFFLFLFALSLSLSLRLSLSLSLRLSLSLHISLSPLSLYLSDIPDPINRATRKPLSGADVHDDQRGRPWPGGFSKNFV